MLAKAVVMLALLCALPACGAAAPMPATTQKAPAPLPSTPAPFFFALSVKDVEASRAWYQKALGFRLKRKADLPERQIRISILETDQGLLELVELPDSRSLEDLIPDATVRDSLRGIYKIGFRVADLDATVRHLEKVAVPLRGKVFTESDGSMRSTQVEDPDHNVVQLFELLR